MHATWPIKSPTFHKYQILRFSAGAIRQMRTDGDVQELAVVDTSKSGRPSHADILSSVRLGEGAARGLRMRMIERLPRCMDVAAAFSWKDKLGFVSGMIRQKYATLLWWYRAWSK